MPGLQRVDFEWPKSSEQEGLFDRETPELVNPITAEEVEPAAYPLHLLADLQSDLVMGAYRHRHNTAIAEKMSAWKQSLQKVEMAYEIIAYPRFENLLYTLSAKERIRDALAHPNQDTNEYPHRAPIELNEEELKILDKLTKARDLPFDPNKRVYRYTELSALREAEHVMSNEIAQRARQNAIDAGIL